MKNEEIILYILNNNGMINSIEAKNANINLRSLQRLEKNGELKRVAKGLYLYKDCELDPLYLLQYRSPKAIFSHFTALFLHKLTDFKPDIITTTVPSGWNSQLIKKSNSYKFYYYKNEKWELGQEQIKSPHGHNIIVYDIERTICDCIQIMDELERKVVIKLIKEYQKDIELINYKKLFRYADKLNIRKIIEIYAELLYDN